METLTAASAATAPDVALAAVLAFSAPAPVDCGEFGVAALAESTPVGTAGWSRRQSGAVRGCPRGHGRDTEWRGVFPRRRSKWNL